MTYVLEEAEVKTSAKVRPGNREAPKLSELGLLDWIGGLFVSLALMFYACWFVQPLYTQALRLLSSVKSLAIR